MPDSDIRLMERIAQGDSFAFEQLVRKYERSVSNTIYRFIGNSSEAEELTQEVFLRVYRAAKRYKPKAKFSTWLYRIVTNLCLYYKRQRDRFPTISLDNPITAEGGKLLREFPAPQSLRPDLLLQKKERSAIVKKAIDSLPDNQRMAVILHRIEGLSYKEISQVMRCSLSAVESLLHRAKKNLKTKLAPCFKREEI